MYKDTYLFEIKLKKTIPHSNFTRQVLKNNNAINFMVNDTYILYYIVLLLIFILSNDGL